MRIAALRISLPGYRGSRCAIARSAIRFCSSPKRAQGIRMIAPKLLPNGDLKSTVQVDLSRPNFNLQLLQIYLESSRCDFEIFQRQGRSAAPMWASVRA